MVKFKIKDKEYQLPEYLTIDKYTKIYKIKDFFTDQYFAARLLSIVMDIPVEDVLKSDYEEINFISMEIMKLIPLDNNIPFRDKFEIDGVKYGFFPNWRDITFAEFIDMDTISTKKPEELLNMLHILAAIMYRPIEHEISEHNFLIEEYDVKTMVPRSELFKNKLDVKVILSASVFFFKLERRFSLFSHLSSIKMNWKMKLKLRWTMLKLILVEIFRKRTDGTSLSIDSLQTILPSTNMSTKKT